MISFLKKKNGESEREMNIEQENIRMRIMTKFLEIKADLKWVLNLFDVISFFFFPIYPSIYLGRFLSIILSIYLC